ncbi:MAG: hypothetical protein JXA67_14725 [Micromonosporaceae bacterium]|nr:hypothetical protein [Micromonosporaceae bacterium]
MNRPANQLLRQARLRRPSPGGSGQPMSRADLAEAVNLWLYEQTGKTFTMDANQVGKYERGENRWPHRHYRQALCAILGAAHPAQLGFYPVRTPSVHGTADALLALPTVEDLAGRDGMDEPFSTETGRLESCTPDRRQVVKLIAALVAAAALTPAESDAVSVFGDANRRVIDDPAVLAGHETIADRLAGMYRSADPLRLLPLATEYADRLAQHLDADLMTEATAARLVPIVVGVHAQIGLWSCHADRLWLARRYLSIAHEVAMAAEGATLQAQAMGALSYLHSSAPRGGTGGNPHRTLALLDTALATATMADSFTRGWLATWRADQHATLGHLDQARRDVDFATTALKRTDDAATAGFFARRNYGYGMAGHLNSVRASVQALTGQTRQSEQTFAEVQASAANARRRVATLGHQAMAAVALDQPEAACAALTRSVSWAVAERYGMGLRRAVGVRATFSPGWSTLPAVRDLDDQLSLVTAT